MRFIGIYDMIEKTKDRLIDVGLAIGCLSTLILG
jgi:hypothetical protein